MLGNSLRAYTAASCAVVAGFGLLSWYLARRCLSKLVKGKLVGAHAVVPIGHVSSVFTQCVGTPRQGLFVPSSRGILKLDLPCISEHALKGLEGTSHIWVTFLFHLNNNTRNAELLLERNFNFPCKVSPPALLGEKVGVFATRSPHRPNPIGFSLCKVERIEVSKKTNAKRFWIHVSALDLVDGTPILDIKPYVPYYDSAHAAEATVPDWINRSVKTKRRVTIPPHVQAQIRAFTNTGKLRFYKADEVDLVEECIREVLERDIRSVHKSKQAYKSLKSSQRIDRLKIHFSLSTDKWCELVHVNKVEMI